MRRAARAIALAVVVAVAAAGAAVAEPVFTRVSLAAAGDEPLDAEWHLPAADRPPPAALVVLQHGFARRCANLRTLAAALAEAGLATVCLNADMSRGNPALAADWADRLAARGADAPTLPDGRALPDPLVVAGHSAGAHAAAVTGERLHAIAPLRLAGAVLLDPVAAGERFATALAAVSDGGRRPVHAVLAEPHACNARGNARAALLAVRTRALAAGRDGFVGVRVVGGTHVDAEGPDTDRPAAWLCGPTDAARSHAVRDLAVRWASAMVDRPLPGAAALGAVTEPIE